MLPCVHNTGRLNNLPKMGKGRRLDENLVSMNVHSLLFTKSKPMDLYDECLFPSITMRGKCISQKGNIVMLIPIHYNLDLSLKFSFIKTVIIFFKNLNFLKCQLRICLLFLDREKRRKRETSM